jgi:predicted nucleic acid-binding Zn ribbon protein
MDKLKDIVERMIKVSGMEEVYLEYRVVRDWKNIVGEGIARNVKAVECREGILKLFCPNAIWRNELIFLKKDIIKKINDFIGKEVVRDIRFTYKRR